MAYMLVRHKVKDFKQWKPYFDEDAKRRKSGGSKGGFLYRNSDDPNEVFLLFKWDKLENAKKFQNREDLRDLMIKAGVSDNPDMYLIEEVEKLSA